MAIRAMPISPSPHCSSFTTTASPARFPDQPVPIVNVSTGDLLWIGVCLVGRRPR
jgi:hypothetical protein